VEVFRIDSLISALRSRLMVTLNVEAIMCFVGRESNWRDTSLLPEIDEVPDDEISIIAAFEFVQALRSMPYWCTMVDGRKWSGVPVMLVHRNTIEDEQIDECTRRKRTYSISFNRDRTEVTRAARRIVNEYRVSILDDLANLGFLVSYDHGRYRVGPAYERPRSLDGELFFVGADHTAPERYLTVHRDICGIERDIEEFEYLLNSSETTEPQLQKYFEDHPGLLDPLMGTIPLPHLPLRKTSGELLIPDFVQRPLVAPYRDSNWRVLDLKRPQAKLLSGPARRRYYSNEVVKAIRQLRDYGEYFRDPAHSTSLRTLLGRPLRNPRLAVLIGRADAKLTDVEALNSEQARNSDVQIVSYDEILEQQHVFLAQHR
jgi:hypothetical protein